MISLGHVSRSPLQECAILLLVGLGVTLIGFIRSVWFISLAYTLSIAFFVATLIARQQKYDEKLSFFSRLYLLGVLVWALRLGLFILMREHNTAYKAAVSKESRGSQSLSLYKKLGIWSSISVLYVSMFSPVVFGVLAPSQRDTLTMPLTSYLGLGILWFGVVFEAVADQQKSNFKSEHPKKFVNSGLYQWVRYPNYLGEILFWVGSFMAGMPGAYRVWHWVVASIGLTCIILIMIGSTKRLESKQNERYGQDPMYKDYCRKVPILLPGVPLFSLKGIRTYLG